MISNELGVLSYSKPGWERALLVYALGLLCLVVGSDRPLSFDMIVIDRAGVAGRFDKSRLINLIGLIAFSIRYMGAEPE